MAEYPFRQGLDYGARKGTLGIAWHMAEGGDGTVTWLAQRPGESRTSWIERVRGVSANAVIQSDGTVWQMVDWSHASGSMNPKDRGAPFGFYNTHVIQSVLGSGWTDPNAWSISVELCGFRREGPTDPQVRAAVAWGRDMQERFPTLRGAYGHADQTDTKGCPGLTANMRAIFDSLGGHGLWTEEEVPGIAYKLIAPAVGTVTTNIDGADLVIPSDGRRVPSPKGQTRDCFARVELREPLPSSAGPLKDFLLVGKLPSEAENYEAALLLETAGTFQGDDTAGEKTFVAIAVNDVIQKSTEILVP